MEYTYAQAEAIIQSSVGPAGTADLSVVVDHALALLVAARTVQKMRDVGLEPQKTLRTTHDLAFLRSSAVIIANDQRCYRKSTHSSFHWEEMGMSTMVSERQIALPARLLDDGL